jgi:hypothetical protein
MSDEISGEVRPPIAVRTLKPKGGKGDEGSGEDKARGLYGHEITTYSIRSS